MPSQPTVPAVSPPGRAVTPKHSSGPGGLMGSKSQRCVPGAAVLSLYSQRKTRLCPGATESSCLPSPGRVVLGGREL